MLTDSVPGESSLTDWQTDDFSLCSHMAFQGSCVQRKREEERDVGERYPPLLTKVLISFLGPRLHHIISFYLFKFPSPTTIQWVFRLQNIEFWRNTNIQGNAMSTFIHHIVLNLFLISNLSKVLNSIFLF